MFDQKEIDYNVDDLFKKWKEETILQYKRSSEDKGFNFPTNCYNHKPELCEFWLSIR
jgi:hypothetical protein